LIVAKEVRSSWRFFGLGGILTLLLSDKRRKGSRFLQGRKIMSANVSLGLSQVDRIACLCDFLDHPAMKAAVDNSVPVSMPHEVGSLGFDTPLWVGLGMVGLWSALDAFAERAVIQPTKCKACGGLNCLSSRLLSTGKLNAAYEQALNELEDVRHLFAHTTLGVQMLSTSRRRRRRRRRRDTFCNQVSVCRSHPELSLTGRVYH
jgi:hypothetical protein